MAKSSAESAADLEPVLMHAVIQSKAKTAEGGAETRAAKSLGVHLVGVIRTSRLTRTWRVQLPDGGQAALVVLAAAATESDRENFARAAGDLHAAGGIPGVLPVRRLAASHDAFLTDLLTTGNAGELAALSWPVRKHLELVRQVARSLDALHQVGLVHGSLWAANVLLDDDLRPVLAEVGMVADAEADPQSDVYSAARLLQELTRASRRVRAVADVVARGTAPPELRYPSARALAEAIEKALEELTSDEPGAPPVRPPPPAAAREVAVAPPPKERDRTEAEPRRRAVWPGIAGIVLLAASLAAAALVGGSNDALRPLLWAAAPLGAALATTLLPALRRGALVGRLALALGAAAMVWLFDPLAFAYHLAAQTRVRGGDDARRAAIDEVMRLGRDFRGFSFSKVGLQGVDLTAADLRGVSFADADLRGAHLYAAEVYGTSFAGAQLAGADLEGTQLQLADTAGATCDDSTRLPAPWRCDRERLAR